jgi:hypothetical protein
MARRSARREPRARSSYHRGGPGGRLIVPKSWESIEIYL